MDGGKPVLPDGLRALAGRPFGGLFVPVDGLVSGLALVGLGEAEALYRALFDLHGWTPRQVDECELWELASLLIREESGKASGNGHAPDGLTGKALIEARLNAHREGKPKPTFGPRPSIVS